MEIIDRLTEENMELRRILGEYEKNTKRSYAFGQHFQDSQAKNSRKQANQYRDALSALFNQRRSRSAVAARSTSDQGRRKADKKEISATHAYYSEHSNNAKPSTKKALAFRSAKSLDEERSVMELRIDRRLELPSMYRNMSSDTSGSSANQKAEVIVINNEGVQSSF
uniref:Uncharacterized protein n=1 Tax=Ditylenchus dipsaci TaxID=166011 RepID=A0A915E4Q3_9BILA